MNVADWPYTHMNDLEASFDARLQELYPELVPIRKTYTRRTGVDCEFNYDLTTLSDPTPECALTQPVRYIIYIEFWDDGTIWYSIEDDSDRYVHAPTPRYEIANPDFTVDQLVADIKTHIAKMPSTPMPDSAIMPD